MLYNYSQLFCLGPNS